MNPLRRSCSSALQSRIPTLFTPSQLPCTTTTTTTFLRAFSQSASHNRGGLPVFLPPSTPELAEHLSTLNRRVLLPCHLTQEQQELVYKPANRARIETEPIEITLGDVTLPLEHLDRLQDIPRRRTVIHEILKTSQTRDDWENVMRMMEGCRNAGIELKPEWKERIVRKLGEGGLQHLILKALQRVEATGLNLSDWTVVVEVVRAVRDKAAMADWEKDELVKALKMAEQVVELMEEDGHLGKVSGPQDWRGHPAVVALPLELAAELVYRYEVEGGEEKVKKYAARLMNALKQKNYLDDNVEVCLLPPLFN